MKPTTEAELTSWRDCYQPVNVNHPFFQVQIRLITGANKAMPPEWERAHANANKADQAERRRRETENRS